MKQKPILLILLATILLLPILATSSNAQEHVFVGFNHDFGISRFDLETGDLINTQYPAPLTGSWGAGLYVYRIAEDRLFWSTPSPLITDDSLNEIIRYSGANAVSRYGIFSQNTNDNETALTVVFGGLRILNLTDLELISSRTITGFQYTTFSLFDEEQDVYIVGSSGYNKIYKIDPNNLNTILTSTDDYIFSEGESYSINKVPYGRPYSGNLLIADRNNIYLVDKNTLNKIDQTGLNVDMSFQRFEVKGDKIFIIYNDRTIIYDDYYDNNPTTYNYDEYFTAILDSGTRGNKLYMGGNTIGSRCEFTSCGEIHVLDTETGVINQDYISRANLLYSFHVDEEEITFEEPEIETIGFNNITTNSVELTGNLTSIGTPESVNVFFQYKKETDTQFTNTPTQLLTNESIFTQELTGLDQNTPYEFRAVVQYENPEIAGALIKTGDSINFTTQEIVFGDNYLFGLYEFSIDLIKKDLTSLEEVVLSLDNHNQLNTLNRRLGFNDDYIVVLKDRLLQNVGGQEGFIFAIIEKESFEEIESFFIPSPTGGYLAITVNVIDDDVFISMATRFYKYNLETFEFTYGTPYTTSAPQILYTQNDNEYLYFMRQNSANLYRVNKNNIDFSNTITPDYSTGGTYVRDFAIGTNNVLTLQGTSGNSANYNTLMLFNKETKEKLEQVSFQTSNHVFDTLMYDESSNNYYSLVLQTLGACGYVDLVEINGLTLEHSRPIRLDYIGNQCANANMRALYVDYNFIYIGGSYGGENVIKVFDKNTYEHLESIPTNQKLGAINYISDFTYVNFPPTILGFPPTKELNQNEFYSLNLFDYFGFAETINLSIINQNPEGVYAEDFFFNGIYNTDYAQFEYEPLTGQFNYLSKTLDYDVTFKATACNEFGCVEDVFRIETFIIPLGLEKNFPNIIMKPNSFRYSFIDEYINEEEKNITNIKLYDENLNLTIINYDYIASENHLNQYYSITMSEDVNGRTFIYYESFEEEYETNITITLTDIDGLQINDTYKFIISDNIPTQIKSVKNPVMSYNDEYTLKLNEHFTDFTAVFFGWYETDALEYKVLVPNEVYTTSYAEFSYVNNTIKIISFEEEYRDLGIPATIQACNTNGCSETQELTFIISEETFFEKNFGWLFPPAEELTGGQRTLRVLLTIAFLLLMVVVLGVQSPEARPYLVPIGTMIVLLSIITFTLMGYLSLVLIITLIFVGVLLGVGLVRRVLIGSNGD